METKPAKLSVSEETNWTILQIFNIIPFYGSYQLIKFWSQTYKLYVKKKLQALANFNEHSGYLCRYTFWILQVWQHVGR